MNDNKYARLATLEQGQIFIYGYKKYNEIYKTSWILYLKKSIKDKFQNVTFEKEKYNIDDVFYSKNNFVAIDKKLKILIVFNTTSNNFETVKFNFEIISVNFHELHYNLMLIKAQNGVICKSL